MSVCVFLRVQIIVRIVPPQTGGGMIMLAVVWIIMLPQERGMIHKTTSHYITGSKDLHEGECFLLSPIGFSGCVRLTSNWALREVNTITER